jgi:hypothetical protein
VPAARIRQLAPETIFASSGPVWQLGAALRTVPRVRQGPIASEGGTPCAHPRITSSRFLVFLRAFFEQEVTETTEKAPALCSLCFLLFMISGFIWLRPKAALVNRDPTGSAPATRSPLG